MRPRLGAARDGGAHHRPPRPRVRPPGPRGARRGARPGRHGAAGGALPLLGTGAWEAALVNTLPPGDKALAFETGHFAVLWAAMAANLGLDVDLVPGDWRSGVAPGQVFDRLSADAAHAVKAVTVVHNETSTGIVSSIPEIRAAIDAGGASGIACRGRDFVTRIR